MATHLSAIAFVHKLQSFPDPTDTFLVKQIMQGARKSRPQWDIRSPITHPILMRLVISLTAESQRNQTLFRCMYLWAFFAFLRVGEMTISHGNTINTLQLSNISINPQAVKVQFYHYKHSRKPAALWLHQQPRAQFCPVQALRDYLALRGSAPGPLFLNTHGKPLTHSAFTTQLKRSLAACQLSPTHYKSHSFRVGATTWFSAQGLSESRLMALGRWKSVEAFRKYIRA